MTPPNCNGNESYHDKAADAGAGIQNRSMRQRLMTSILAERRAARTYRTVWQHRNHGKLGFIFNKDMTFLVNR